jgi:hypothetical protein
MIPPAFPPQPLFAAQAFLQRDRLQLVHDPGARLHHAVTVPQQLPQIPVLPTRHPDLRETILQQQAQDQLRVLAIRLLLAYSLGADLRRVSDPQLKLQLRHQSFEPACVPAGLHSNPHLLASQDTVELFCLLTMSQPFFPGTLRSPYPPKRFAQTRGESLLL